MAYRAHTAAAIKASPLTLGSRLGRRAVNLEVSVTDLALFTGATRRTLYKWMQGGYILPPYRERVDALYSILRSSSTRDEALSRACKAFNVKL